MEFLVGRNGDFDTLVSSVIRRAIAELDYGNASHILVLPYETAEFRDNTDSYKEYYTEVEICEQATAVHFRAAIQIRNKAMVDRSDLIVCCIEHNNGGAYKTIMYAEKQGVPIINISSIKKIIMMYGITSKDDISSETDMIISDTNSDNGDYSSTELDNTSSETSTETEPSKVFTTDFQIGCAENWFFDKYNVIIEIDGNHIDKTYIISYNEK